MTQKFTSANTSINQNKIPVAIQKAVKFNGSILDYGCGKYIDHIAKYANDNGCSYYGYDPYNQHNELPESLFDMVTISNVLNVIAEDDIILNIVQTAFEHCRNCVIIGIYQGNGSGIGKQSKADCFQRNQPLKWYIEFLQAHGFNAISKSGVILIEK